MLTHAIPAHVRNISRSTNFLKIRSNVVFCFAGLQHVENTMLVWCRQHEPCSLLPCSVLCVNKLLLVRNIIIFLIFNRVVNCHGNRQSISAPASWHFQLAQKCSLNKLSPVAISVVNCMHSLILEGFIEEKSRLRKERKKVSFSSG